MSAKIHDIIEAKAHNAGPAKCLACKHEWVAVAPIGVDTFECPACGCFKGLYKGVAQRPEHLHYTCGCKAQSQYFHLTDLGPYCIACGNWADWDPRPPMSAA